MPFDTSQFKKAGESAPAPTNRPFINPNQDEWNLGDYAAPLVRGIAGLAPGGFIGSGASGLAEILAQTIEGRPQYNWNTVGLEAALGAIPFRGVGKIGRQAFKGSALAGSGAALRQQTEGGLHIPDEDELKEIALSTGIGALGGAAAGAITKKFDTTGFKKATPVEKANKEVSKAVAQAAETKIPTKTAEVVTEVKPAETIIAAEPAKVFDNPKLPRNLRGEKSGYGKYQLKWDSDIDRALYIIANPKSNSAAHDKYMAFLQKYTGRDEKELRTLGQLVKKNLATITKGKDTNIPVTIPKINNLEITYVPKGRNATSKSAVDVITGKPIDVATNTPAPTVTSTTPQVDLQTASPKVIVDDEIPLVDTGFGMMKPVKYPDDENAIALKVHPIRRIAAEGRQLQTGLDLSFPFRQGISNWTRKEFRDSFIPMFKAFKSKTDFDELQKTIANNPAFELAEKAGIDFAGLGRRAKLTEEAITRDTWMSRQLGIKHSNRAYEAFSNKLRMDLFTSMAKDATKAGVKLLDHEGNITANAKAIAQYINDGTGRGHLGQLEKNAALMNDLMFSPKLMASRVNMLRRAFQDPRMIEGADSALATQLRQRAIRDMLGVGGLAAASIGLSQINGAEETMSPRSTDFGKIKIGNTRIDLTGGFQQYLRLATQLAMGSANVEGSVQKRNRLDTAERFARTKLSPMAGLIADWMAEKNVIGEKFTWDQATKDRMIPLIIQDIWEVIQEESNPLVASAAGAGSIFGAGVQSYGRKPINKSASPGSFKFPKAPQVNLPKY